jgi:hypothetical protein
MQVSSKVKPLSTLLLALAAGTVGCHPKSRAPTPLPSIALPAGANLHPWSDASPSKPWPQGSVQLGGRVFVALGNVSATDPYLPPAGPGLVVSVVPSTGAQSVIDLGGDDQHQCVNPYALTADSGKLYVACTGSFGDDTRGRGVAEVDPGAGRVLRFAPAPDGFMPSAVAVTASRVWVGDTSSDSVLALDRGTFAIASPAASLGCPQGKYGAFIAAATVLAGDLYVLCGATDGYVVRLDAATGAAKGDKALVGANPVAFTVTGDGRLAVVNSTSTTLTLVAPSAGALAVQQDVLKFENSADLEDVRARDQFVYVMSAQTQTAIKVDISGAQPKIVDEVNVNPSSQPNSNPTRIEVLDDDQAVVVDTGLGTMVGVQFGQTKK